MKFRVAICLLVVCFMLVDPSASWRRRRRRRRRRCPPPPVVKPKPCTISILIKKVLSKYGSNVVSRFLQQGYRAYRKYRNVKQAINGALQLCALIGDESTVQPVTANDYEAIMKASVSKDEHQHDTDLAIYDIPVLMEDEWDQYVKDIKNQLEESKDFPMMDETEEDAADMDIDELAQQDADNMEDLAHEDTQK